MLDFGGTSDVLFIGDASTVAFDRITVAGFARPNGRGSPIADSVFWPSVQLAPGATVSCASAEVCQGLCFVLAYVHRISCAEHTVLLNTPLAVAVSPART